MSRRFIAERTAPLALVSALASISAFGVACEPTPPANCSTLRTGLEVQADYALYKYSTSCPHDTGTFRMQRYESGTWVTRAATRFDSTATNITVRANICTNGAGWYRGNYTLNGSTASTPQYQVTEAQWRICL